MADPPTPSGNRLLDRLPKHEYRRLSPFLSRVSLDFKEALYEACGRIDSLYFPRCGVLSALHVMEDGSTIEVATFGREGAAGVPAFLGVETSLHRLIVQIPGDALRIDVALLRREADLTSLMGKLLVRYYAAFLGQISNSVACNGLHPIKKRCCRWLLTTHDRLDSDTIPLTHEYLAAMLGVRRPGVSVVLQSLKEQRLVDYNRGTITILDRPELEAVSCECYRRAREDYERLLG